LITQPTIPRHRQRRPRLAYASLAALLSMALFAAACSSSNKTKASAGSATTASSAAPTSGGTPSGLAEAEALVAKSAVQPAKITVTQAITKPIPKGKTVYFIPCGANPECQQEGQIVKQAADLLGWKTVVLPNDGTPQQSKAAFDQVVRAKADAVLYTAIPQAIFQSEIPALKANNTAVITCCVTDPTGSGVDYNIDDPTQGSQVNNLLAAFVASDSKCKNNDSVIVNLPDFAILSAGVGAYKSAMGKFCPGANVAQLDVALADLANAPTNITSYVRSHPNVKYVVATTDGLTTGAPASLKAAGLTGVKLVGQGATPTNIQYLHSGQQVADVAFPYNEVMWAMVHAAAQHVAGEPITPSVAPPQWLLTPQNAPNTSAAIFPVVQDYQAQYKALWGLS
jgi:ribose transport system substrate-binding protein